jgi:hypothetical protein
LAFVRKYRREVFSKAVLDDYKHLSIHDIQGGRLCLDEQPKRSFESSDLEKNYPGIHKKLENRAHCSPSYFTGSCGSIPIYIIRQSIEQQQTSN